MSQDDRYSRAIREAVRGVLAYARTGKAPQLSICGSEPPGGDADYGRAVEEIAELLHEWEVLDGDEVERIVKESPWAR